MITVVENYRLNIYPNLQTFFRYDPKRLVALFLSCPDCFLAETTWGHHQPIKVSRVIYYKVAIDTSQYITPELFSVVSVMCLNYSKAVVPGQQTAYPHFIIQSSLVLQVVPSLLLMPCSVKTIAITLCSHLSHLT